MVFETQLLIGLKLDLALSFKFLFYSTCTDLQLTFNKVIWSQMGSISHEVAIALTTPLAPSHGVNLVPTGNMLSISSFIKVKRIQFLAVHLHLICFQDVSSRVSNILCRDEIDPL